MIPRIFALSMYRCSFNAFISELVSATFISILSSSFSSRLPLLLVPEGGELSVDNWCRMACEFLFNSSVSIQYRHTIAFIGVIYMYLCVCVCCWCTENINSGMVCLITSALTKDTEKRKYKPQDHAIDSRRKIVVVRGKENTGGKYKRGPHHQHEYQLHAADTMTALASSGTF